MELVLIPPPHWHWGKGGKGKWRTHSALVHAAKRMARSAGCGRQIQKKPSTFFGASRFRLACLYTQLFFVFSVIFLGSTSYAGIQNQADSCLKSAECCNFFVKPWCSRSLAWQSWDGPIWFRRFLLSKFFGMGWVGSFPCDFWTFFF